MDPEYAVDTILQAAAGADAAHSRGIMHLDINPSNIFIRDDGKGGEQAVLGDFGIWRKIPTAPYVFSGDVPANGTWPYTPLEQLLGEPCPQSDVYSMSASLYQMIEGVLPFDAGDSPVDWLAFHLGPDQQVSAFSEKDAVHREIFKVVKQGLAASLNERQQTVREFRQGLRFAFAAGLQEMQSSL